MLEQQTHDDPIPEIALADRAQINDNEQSIIRSIAGSGSDHPVLMLNLNRYTAQSGFPDGKPYRDYMAALDELLPQVGGRILWRSPVAGQPVGDQRIDEVLAAWYPSHQAFVDLPTAPGGESNFRLRRECVEYAVIHRCVGNFPPLDGS